MLDFAKIFILEEEAINLRVSREHERDWKDWTWERLKEGKKWGKGM